MLPQKFPTKSKASKPGLVDPKNWNALIDYVAALQKEIIGITPRSGADIGVRQTKGGSVFFLKSRGTPGSTGEESTAPFHRVFTNVDGVLMLLGGIVSGGDGNITVPDIELWSGDGDPPPDGRYHFLNCSFSAYVEDDVLMPGGTVNGAIPSQGTSLPQNQTPEAPSGSGRIYVSLGVWSQGKFLPAAPGNILIGHCPGQLTSTRQ